MKSININSELLSYTDNINGEITLLFLHGAFINKEYWSEQISNFESKYRVLTVDFVGHGSSTHNRKELTIQNFGQDINELIELLELKNVIIIGHSFGSDVMLETVTLNLKSIIGLIEVDHLKNIGNTLPKETIDFLVQNLEANFDATCEQIAKQALLTENTNTEITEKLINDYKKMDKQIGTKILELGFHYSEREVELLKSLKHKLYLIHVDYSETNEENLKIHLKDNYEIYKIKGTCHYPMIENPKEFNKILTQVIEKIQNEKKAIA